MPTVTDSSQTAAKRWRLLPGVGLLCALLLAAGVLALASCANAVNSHGGPVDEGGSSGSAGASSGSNTTRNGRGGYWQTALQAAFRTAVLRLTSLSAPTPQTTRLTAAAA